MKAGDVIFVRGKSPLSKLVRFFDKGKWSHCAIAVSDTHIFEADWYTKATIKEFYYDSDKYEYEVMDLGFTHEERELIVHGAIQMVGKWYDYLQILGYILKRFFSTKGKNKFNSPNMLICSEALFNLLALTGRLSCAVGMDVDVTPNQLYTHMKNLKECGVYEKEV